MTQPTFAARDLRRILPGSQRVHQNLQEATLDWCRLHRIPAVPIHTGPRVTPRGDGGFDLRSNHGQIGFADVLICLPPFGRAVLAECKSGRARKSADQVALHQRFAAVGALSLTVRSVDDLSALLAQIAHDRAIESVGARRKDRT